MRARLGLAFGLALPALGPVTAQAAVDPVVQPEPQRLIPRLETVLTTVVGVEARMREIEAGLNARGGEAPPDELAARRMTDAQVLYTFKNYEAAATILYDVVDRFAKTPTYPEALFYLGDSLFLKRDYLSSQRYFARLAEGYPQHPRYQEALLRLLEIAFHLGQYGQADVWMDRLGQVPKDKTLASVPYVRGKYFFIKKDYDRAIAAMTPINEHSPYYFQARYFIGASHVAKGELMEAVNDFAALLQMAPRSDEEKRVLELGHMALGRIFYEQGQNTRAQEEYLQISQKSDLFPDALYESAWVSIKAKEFKTAERSLELLVLAQPDALTAPEAELLIGNLQTRLSDYVPATQWFVKTRDEFEPVKNSLNALLTQNGDPAQYFRNLIEKNASKFDVATVVGKTAARFLRGEPGVARYFALSGDVGELRRSLDEADDTIRRLEKAMSGQKRYNVDPELAVARESSLRMAEELLLARRDLVQMLIIAVTPVCSVEERAQLSELSQRREALNKELVKLLGQSSAQARAEQRRAEINELDKRTAEFQVHLINLRKQREAVEGYYATTRKQQKITAQQFEHDVAAIKEQEAQATADYEKLRHDLAEAMNAVSADENQAESENRLRSDYAGTAGHEEGLLTQLRMKLSGAERTRADAIAEGLSRTGADEAELGKLSGTIAQRVEVKLAQMMATLTTEKQNVRGYRQTLDGYGGETDAVGGDVLGSALRATARRFYDIVVRADVGVLDVAWALKQQRTEKVSRMVREQKREMKLLDDEFKEVLNKE